jgi:hypothetical protein
MRRWAARPDSCDRMGFDVVVLVDHDGTKYGKSTMKRILQVEGESDEHSDVVEQPELKSSCASVLHQPQLTVYTVISAYISLCLEVREALRTPGLAGWFRKNARMIHVWIPQYADIWITLTAVCDVSAEFFRRI